MKKLFMSFILLPASTVMAAEMIDFKISKRCKPGYERYAKGWGDNKFFGTPMAKCERNSKQAAHRVEILVDKAGRDNSPIGSWVKETLSFRQKQRVYVKAFDEKGNVVFARTYRASTGNAMADGKYDKGNITPVGTYSLKRNNNRTAKNKKIVNSQAYCVQNHKLSYTGAPMPYAIFFKGGYAIHAGDIKGGGPDSHGCVRILPHRARELYCLLRQRKDKFSAENWERTTIKVVDKDTQGPLKRGLASWTNNKKSLISDGTR